MKPFGRVWGPVDRLRWIGGLATAILSVAAGGCRKEKDSLVVVQISAAAADTNAKNMVSVTIGVGSVSDDFPLMPGTGIPNTPATVSFGVYVPSSQVGTQTVSVNAKPPAGTATSCDGETGSQSITIGAAGDTVPAMVNVVAGKAICSTGGSSGTGGSAGIGGQGGSGTGGQGTGTGGQGTGTGGQGTGTGGQGATGTGGRAGAGAGAPTFANCTEINHDDAPACGSSCTSAQDIGVFGAAFSPTNPQLFVTGGGDGRIKVWQVSNGTPTATGHVLTGTGLGVVAFSPDGTQLAVGRVAGVEIWNVAAWTLVRTLTIANEAYDVAFSPDGSQVITLDRTTAATTNNSVLYVHAVGTVQALHQVTLTDGYSLAVSPVSASGSFPVAVSTGEGSALVYSLTSAGFSAPTTLTVTSDGSLAETVRFSPQGNLLAAGGDDGLLHFWNVPVSATAGTLSPDIDIINASANTSDDVVSIAFSPQGSYLALGAGFFGSVTGWQVAAPRAQVGGEYDTPNVYDMFSIAYAPDGKLIVGGEADCGCVVFCPQ